MLDFDSEAFFETVLRLFTGDPWRFITNQGKYKFQFEKEAPKEVITDLTKTRRSTKADSKVCQIPVANKLLTIFKRAAENSTRLEPERSRACF
mmetsp:Transcript_21491/g.28805  ORF Transcript_21491/g.28805 Transcript_21491/m.28805 type:complete len:93 (+) Transcript_21491:53-331(+)